MSCGRVPAASPHPAAVRVNRGHTSWMWTSVMKVSLIRIPSELSRSFLRLSFTHAPPEVSAIGPACARVRPSSDRLRTTPFAADA